MKDRDLDRDLAFSIRAGRLSDWPFVLDSWLTSYRGSARARDMLGAGVYWTEHKATARSLLGRGVLTVAHAPDDADAILGWACTSLPPPQNPDPLVHYVYVRGGRAAGARRFGIASALLADFIPHPCTFTHRPQSERIPIPDCWQYNPERNYR